QLLGVKHNTAVGQLRARHLPRAFAASGVTPFTPHGLRRGGVDALLRAGVDFGTAASLLGHSPKAMLDFYRQATADDRRRAVAAAALGRLEPLGRKVIAFPGSGDSSVD
ncbi:MAG: tyrosine-type recombinase/integrase, partial [Alphaproteobacteria bacterium]|nr:tyrosine-type recombinase/integrase [Alphaproteobacteria bacterium]